MAIQRDKVITNAEKLVAKGKIEPAIKEYERLLDDNPNDVNTLNRIGDLWVRINRNDEAVKVFGRIADHYSKDGFFLKAIAIFKKINKLDPSKLDVYSKLADLYAKQGLAMEAKSQYQVLADYYQKHGDPGNALATYRKIADLDPNSINVHVKLADLYSQNNQSAEALKEYDRVGKMLLKRGMLDEALQVFRKALKIDSGNVDLAESVVTTLLEAKDFNSAIQLIESTLETNKQNPKLVSLLGRTQVAKGDLAAARGVLEKGVSNNPTDAGLREALADLYLRQGSPDQALSTVSPLIDSLLAKSDRSAIEHLNRIVKAEPLHIPTLEKLVQAYTKLREETNIVMALNSLTEAHIARKSFEEATSTLQELIKREPENAQHRKKLAFVRQSTGEAPEPQMAESSYAPPLGESFPDLDLPSAELYELDMSSPESEISFDLDASESMGGTDLGGSGFGMDTSAMESEGVLDQPGAEDLDFITEHMTEAEVFAKYGLSEKAIEHLRVVLGRSPQNVEAHEKLLRIYLDEGDHDNTQEVAGEYLSILRDLGDESAAAAVRAQLTARGYAISEGASVTVRFGGAAAVPGPAAAPAVSKPAPPSPRAATPAPKPPSRPAPPPPPPVAPEPEEIPMEFALSEMEEPEVELDLDAMTGEEEYLEPLPEETLPPLEAEEPLFDLDGALSEEPADLSFEEEAAPETAPAIEEIGEIDFYLEQDLLQEAELKLDSLLVIFPTDPDLLQRQATLTQRLRAKATPPPPAAPAAPAVPPPMAFSAADIENELMSAIPDDDDDIEVMARPVAAALSRAAAPKIDEGNLFADEDDFFDLAAELEDELAEEADDSISLSEEEQSLEEIFREFKKGVESQLDSEDYDTHYNLGIAYKEMGLIDEAIGEFQLAAKDPKRAIECCSMLGLCFLEKGMPQLAIKWYRKGLDVDDISEDEHLGMLYDLGSAYMEVGDIENAHKAFIEVYGLNTNYRDIVTKMKSLEDVKS